MQLPRKRLQCPYTESRERTSSPWRRPFSRRNLLVSGLKRNHPLKHGTVYSKPWPTGLAKIKNLHVEVRAGPVLRKERQPPSRDGLLSSLRSLPRWPRDLEAGVHGAQRGVGGMGGSLILANSSVVGRFVVLVIHADAISVVSAVYPAAMPL